MQTSFLQREIFSVIPLANGGVGFIWGEVGMRKIKENLKGHREEELFVYGKRVIFLLSPSDGPGAMCNRHSGAHKVTGPRGARL